MRPRFLLFCLALGSAPAAAQPSAFEAPADLFYLHPLVNYAHPLRWQTAFEEQRLARGGLQTTVGSISTKDFATAVRLELAERVHDRLRLHFRHDWNESPHVDGGERITWIGLELTAFRSRFGVVGGSFLVHPTSDKGELDLLPGIVWTDAARRRYLRLEWRRDDSVYGEKNDVGGVQDESASGPAWALHWRHGSVVVAGEATFLGAFARRFDDPARNGGIASTRQRRSWSSHAVRWGDRAQRVELRFEHRDLAWRQTGDAPERQDARWRHLRLAWESEWAPRWRVRASLHRLWYDNAFESVDHERRETMGGVFVERAVAAQHWIDLGWMSTDFAWTSVPDGSVYGRDQSGVASKLAVGWTFEIDDRAWLRALLSHEPDPQQFGGANVQAQVLF